MHSFKLINQKCIKCGICQNECPLSIIDMNDNKLPEVRKEKIEGCIGCLHCFAVCPAGAISIDNYDPEKSCNLKNSFPEYAKLETLVKGRRSVRKFKSENIEKEKLQKLLSDALHAPTGTNSMKVRFTVIDEKDTLDKYKKEIYTKIKCLADNNKLPEGFEFYSGIVEKWFSYDFDILFRNAPHMIIASAPESCTTPEVDTVIALSYLDLLAPAMGFGTLWCGLGKWAINDILPEYKQILGIPEDHKIGYVMLLGKPNVKYSRTVQRPTDIKYIK